MQPVSGESLLLTSRKRVFTTGKGSPSASMGSAQMSHDVSVPGS